MSTRIKLVIAYDGTNYIGFQAQKQGPTIEEELAKAINQMTGVWHKIYGSGRTDRYVHAKGQVVHFDTSLSITPKAFVKGLNSFLPLDIRVIDACEVSDTFHSRFSAIKKEYRYYIMTEYDVFKRNYAAYYPNLDIDKMREAISLFVGSHDFKGFCSVDIHKQKDTNKTIYEAKINIKEDLIEFVFIGNGFLKYQIRRMMGLLIEIGQNKKDKEFILRVLKSCDPRESHKVAVGCGLYLMNVFYEEN